MDLNPRVGKKALSRLRVSRCVWLPRWTSESQPPRVNSQIKQANKFQTEQKPFRESPQSQPGPCTCAVACPLLRETQCNSLTRQCWKLTRISTAGCSLESFRYYLLSHWPLRRSLCKTGIMSCNFSTPNPFHNIFTIGGNSKILFSFEFWYQSNTTKEEPGGMIAY